MSSKNKLDEDLDETGYLLNNPVNAKRLKESIDQVESKDEENNS